jgi:hypothetical protein
MLFFDILIAARFAAKKDAAKLEIAVLFRPHLLAFHAFTHLFLVFHGLFSVNWLRHQYSIEPQPCFLGKFLEEYTRSFQRRYAWAPR